MKLVVEAGFGGNHLQTAAAQQHFLGMIDPDGKQSLQRAFPGELLVLVGERGGAHVQAAGQGRQDERFTIMGGQPLGQPLRQPDGDAGRRRGDDTDKIAARHRVRVLPQQDKQVSQ